VTRRLATLAALVAVAAVAATAPAAGAQAPTKVPGELTVALSMPAAGFQVGVVRGREVVLAKGFEIDLARAIAAQLAIPAVRYVNEERFPALTETGPKDWDLGLAQVTVTEQRASRVSFSRPYFRADQGVLLNRSVVIRPRTLRALRGLQLCAERGSTGADVVRERVRPRRRVRLVGDLSRLEADLYQRRCDAVVADAPQLGVMRARAPRRFGALAGRIRTGELYAATFERGSALRPLVDEAILTLQRNGTLDRLARRWLTRDVGDLRILR
jgi:ABC-type amino acid transport substrate-binding protein